MPIFVVQEHRALKAGHHFDLRLEIGGVLRSWAVKKRIPLKPGLRRLAVLTDDHDLSYATFEGEIEDGYGAGKVTIWDSGTYEVIKQDEKSLKAFFRGKKLSGVYKLVMYDPADPDGRFILFKVDAT